MVTQTRNEPPLQSLNIEPSVGVSPAEEGQSLAWFTIETALYTVIFLLALALRFWQLSQYPLSDVEAQQSLLAWRLLQGESIQSSEAYSPLLVSLNAFSFLLFGGSDATARLASVLLGGGLVLLPYTLRRHLGVQVCLIAAGLLAFVPTILYLSRTVNGEIGVAVGALMLISGFLNWSVDGQRRWLFLGAAGAALLLTAGVMAVTMILVFALIILIGRATFKGLWTSGLQLASQEKESPVANEAGTALQDATTADEVYSIANPALIEREHDTEDTAPNVWLQLPDLRHAALLLGAFLVILSTTAFLNLPGFSLITASVGEWLNRFGFITQPGAGFNAIFLLTIYEPLLVFSGLIGLTLVIMRGNFSASIFAGWFVFALLLDIPMGGRPNSSLILVLVPLAFLAAFALAELWQSLVHFGTWNNEGILVGSGLTIAGFSYIGLTAWLVRTCGSDETACQLAWLQPLAGLVLFIVILIFFGLITDWGVALRGTALVGVVVGLLVLVNIGWRLNYGPLTQHTFQPLAGISASPELINLTDTIETQSIRRVGDPKLIDITISGVDSPALRWQLRNYDNLREGAVSPTSIIITPLDTELSIEGPYIGQDFALDTLWSPVGMTPQQLTEWLIYRTLDQPTFPPQNNRVIFWLQLENE